MSLFFGGVPTKPDVDRLMELDPQHGMEVPYEQIERLIGVPRTRSRFLTIVNSWRLRVFRERLIQSSASGGKILFLTAEKAHDKSISGFHKVGRATRRAMVRAEAIDTLQLSDIKQKEQFLLRRELHALRAQIEHSAKELADPKPVQSTGVRLAAAQ
jgi:hypothetical protein